MSSFPDRTPRKIVHVLDRIEDQNSAGVYVIEISENADIFSKASVLLNDFFNLYDWDFHNVIDNKGVLGNLPSGLTLESASLASSVLHLGSEDGSKRKFVYEIDDKNSCTVKVQIESEQNNVDLVDLSSIGQPSFATLASIFAAPAISLKRRKKKIGILFDGHPIDSKNRKCTFEYLKHISTSESLCIFLLVISGSNRLIDEFYSETVNRIGIYSSGRFTRTNSFSRSLEIANSIVCSIKADNKKVPLFFFLGAGTSIEAGFPSTEELMIDTMKRLLKIPEESTVEIEQLKDRIRDRIISKPSFLEGENASTLHLTLERVMSEEFDDYRVIAESPTLKKIKKISEKPPSPSHLILAKLFDKGLKPIFLTTNYDDLIERSFESGKSQSIVKESDFLNFKDITRDYLSEKTNRVPIFKLHGCIHDFESIKASVEATRLLDTPKISFLTSIYNGDLIEYALPETPDATTRIFFIGYGFNDFDINSVFDKALPRNRKTHMLLVNPNPSPNALRYLRKANNTEGSRDMTSDVISIRFSDFSNYLKNSFSL